MSISTSALMPSRSGGSPAFGTMTILTAMRCTTFTQLPEAFCAGSSENSEPVACEMLSTRPCHAWFG